MKSHERDVREREHLVQTLAEKYGIKGYDYSPLEDERVSEFELRLKDLARRHNAELEKLQDAGSAKTASLEKKERELSTKQNRQTVERDSAREQIVSQFSL
jgi:DNA repair protein RAD50